MKKIANENFHRKIGKYTSLDRLKLDSPRDMVPLVYPTSMKVDPLIIQLDKEHDDITRMHKANPGAKFADLTEKYYLLEEEKERQAYMKMIISQGANTK